MFEIRPLLCDPFSLFIGRLTVDVSGLESGKKVSMLTRSLLPAPVFDFVAHVSSSSGVPWSVRLNLGQPGGHSGWKGVILIITLLTSYLGFWKLDLDFYLFSEAVRDFKGLRL